MIIQKFFTFSIALLLFISCESQNSHKSTTAEKSIEQTSSSLVTLLNAQAFHEGVINKNVQLIDIRTPQEFAQGHIEGAININFFDANFPDLMSNSFDPNLPIYIYCRSGNRTGMASRMLVQKGFVKIFDLQNGIGTWMRNGLPLVQ